MNPGNEDQKSTPRAWLVRRSGPLSGARHPLRGAVTRVGRGPGNDVVMEGAEAAVVSSQHLEIRQEADRYRLRDLNSTNGTYLNGDRVTEAVLDGNDAIRLGPDGPELGFELETSTASDLAKTMVLRPGEARGPQPSDLGEPPSQRAERRSPMDTKHEELLANAVAKARQARGAGSPNQTAVIMGEMLGTVLRRTGKKLRITIAVSVFLLAAVTAYGLWRIQDLKRQKLDIDAQIQQIELALQQGGQNPGEIEQLIETLDGYQTRAQALQSSMFYQFGVEGREEAFIEHEIKVLMAEFGAEAYSIPPEFIGQVQRFIIRYQQRDRPHMVRALQQARREMETIRAILYEKSLPPDLAYMVLVESGFMQERFSPAGAAGPWQLTSLTARGYGLRVDDQVDERFDLKKSTQAAARYIRELILDFGSGSSVMLALAAYNFGPRRVKRAIRRVEDPIKQRNFWYLYRVRALPAETREYVPKIIAAIIIGRNPSLFGFEESTEAVAAASS